MYSPKSQISLLPRLRQIAAKQYQYIIQMTFYDSLFILDSLDFATVYICKTDQRLQGWQIIAL